MVLCTPPALKQKHTLVLLHPSVSHWTDFKQQQQLAEPDIIHPQLKHAIRDARGSDKHHVLAIGPMQFPFDKWE